MKQHLLCLKHPETRGPTTRVAFVGAVAAAAPGMSSYPCDTTPELGHNWRERARQLLGP